MIYELNTCIKNLNDCNKKNKIDEINNIKFKIYSILLGIYSSMHDKNKNGKYINESINKILDELCKIMNVDKILEIDDNKILNKLRRIIFDNCKNNEIDIDKYCQMFQYFMKGYNYYSMYPNIDIVNNYINKKLLKIGNKISLL